MNWYLEVLKKYAVFDGRARRKEYWMFFLFNVLISIVLTIVEMSLGIFGVSLIYSLAVLIPGIAVSVRRLHDINKSGLWLLIAFIPFIGAIVLLVFFVIDGTQGNNDYGPSPK